MNMQEKINDELKSIHYEKGELLNRFERAKEKFIKLLQTATPEEICNLENYNAVSDIKDCAFKLEILNAKLRVYNYLIDETR